MLLIICSLFAMSGQYFIVLSGDNTAPSLKCPPDQKVIAEKSQTWKRVDWVEPTANDGVDGPIT